jgi:hypothetical protein
VALERTFGSGPPLYLRAIEDKPCLSFDGLLLLIIDLYGAFSNSDEDRIGEIFIFLLFCKSGKKFQEEREEFFEKME